MSKETLKEQIDLNINTNVLQQITGAKLNDILNDVVDEMATVDENGKIPNEQINFGVVEEGNTQAVSGDRVFQSVNSLQNKILTEKQTPTILRDNTYTTNKWQIGNFFTGYGIAFGVYKNVTKATMKIVQKALEFNPTPATQVIFRICENNKDGVVLYREVRDINIPSGVTQDIVFEFPLIRNDNNSNIWVEFVANSTIGFAQANDVLYPFYYKTSGYSDFSQGISLNNFPNTEPFYLKLEGVLIHEKLKESLVTDILSETNDLPIKSGSVAKAINEIKYDESQVYYKTEVINEVISENTFFNSYDYERSVFSGWGGLIPFANNFNALELIIKAWDSTSVVTKVKVRICKGAYDAEVIANKTIDVVLDGTNPNNVTIQLDNEINIEDYDGNLWLEYCANGKVSLALGSSDISQKLRYQINNVLLDFNASGGSFEVTSEPSSIMFYYKLGNTGIEYNLHSKIEDKLIDKVVHIVQENLIEEADLLLTSRVWLYPSSEYNIFNKNVCTPKFGDNLNNYRLDFNGNIGAQFNRGYRYTIGASINQNITLNLMKGREILTTKTQNLLSSAVDNGNGVTRNVLLIGDSTVNGSNISTPLKAVFDADVMNINLIGTLGATGVKHEGRGGWTVNDYATIGRKLYVVPVSGITTAPSVGAVYKQIAGNDFKVEEVNISGGNGYFSVSMASGSVELAVNGTLTKVSGNGDSTINYTGVTVTSANPFYNPATEKFDIAYYLTQTGQTLSSGDWVGFQLGINDVFGITDLNSATTKVNAMISQMNEMIANIHLYNSSIRIAICVTFPPADQDAFGYNYGNGQLSEMYAKTGLVTWQNRLLTEFDNETKINQRIYLVSAHLNLDTEYNYPTTDVAVNSRNTTLIKMQNNGVHPSTTGYAQIADMYAGLIKYFG